MDYKFYDENYQDVIWSVNYCVSPYVPERRNGHPDSWSQEEGEEVDWIEVTDENGIDITDSLPLVRFNLILGECLKDYKQDN